MFLHKVFDGRAQWAGRAPWQTGLCTGTRHSTERQLLQSGWLPRGEWRPRSAVSRSQGPTPDPETPRAWAGGTNRGTGQFTTLFLHSTNQTFSSCFDSNIKTRMVKMWIIKRCYCRMVSTWDWMKHERTNRLKNKSQTFSVSDCLQEVRNVCYILFSQGLTFLLNIESGNPKPAQQTHPASICAVCRQGKLHLQQPLKTNKTNL